MTRVKTMRWTLAALIPALALLVILPAVAQRPDGQDRSQEPPGGDVNVAKEIVRLIEAGQLSLTDATELAEKHVDGEALRVICHVVAEDASRPGGDGSRPSPDGAQPAGKRLQYEIACFSKDKDKVQEVRVDGLTKKVSESPTTPSRP